MLLFEYKDIVDEGHSFIFLYIAYTQIYVKCYYKMKQGNARFKVAYLTYMAPFPPASAAYTLWYSLQLHGHLLLFS